MHTTPKLDGLEWMGEIRFAPKSTPAQHVTARIVTDGPTSGTPSSGGGKPWHGPLPRVVDASVFMSTPPPTRPEVISGIVHRGAMLGLGAASKMGKTWTLLDLVVSVATGSPFWGFDTAKGRVLYINLELPHQDLHKRIFEICKAKELSLPAHTIALWNLRGVPSADITTIIDMAILNFPPGTFSLIVIDPIYKCYNGRDENNAAQMAQMLDQIDCFGIQMQATVAFAAHFAKGNAAAKSAIDRISGSGVFGRYPDTIITATEHKLPNRYTVDITARSFAEMKPFVIKWNFPLMEHDAAADPYDLETSNGPTYDRMAFIAVLAPKPLGAGEWKHAAFQAINLKPTSFGSLRSEVITKGWVTGSDKVGYSLTPAGLKLVQETKQTSAPMYPGPEVPAKEEHPVTEEKDSKNPSPSDDIPF